MRMRRSRRTMLRARVVIAADGRGVAARLGAGAVPLRRSPQRWAFGAYFAGVDGLTTRGEMHVRATATSASRRCPAGSPTCASSAPRPHLAPVSRRRASYRADVSPPILCCGIEVCRARRRVDRRDRARPAGGRATRRGLSWAAAGRRRRRLRRSDDRRRPAVRASRRRAGRRRGACASSIPAFRRSRQLARLANARVRRQVAPQSRAARAGRLAAGARLRGAGDAAWSAPVAHLIGVAGDVDAGARHVSMTPRPRRARRGADADAGRAVAVRAQRAHAARRGAVEPPDPVYGTMRWAYPARLRRDGASKGCLSGPVPANVALAGSGDLRRRESSSSSGRSRRSASAGPTSVLVLPGAPLVTRPVSSWCAIPTTSASSAS